MTTRTLPLAPCSLVSSGTVHEPHTRTLGEAVGRGYTIRKRHCPGVAAPAQEQDDVPLPRVRCGHCQGYHASIDGVRRCSGVNAPAATDPDTGRPHRTGRDVPSQPAPNVLREMHPAAADTAPWAPGHESSYPEQRGACIRPEETDEYRQAEDAYRRPTNAAERAQEEADAARVPTRRPPAGEGVYRKDGVIYKVQLAHHGSGKPYAKRLEFVEGRDTGDSGKRGTWHFTYAPGMVRELGSEHKLTVEQAAEFGKLYGVCCVCGRILTDEKSIAAGIGPVCAGRL